MKTIPEEWIDKLFNCLAQFYGDRWKKLFSKPHMEKMHKTTWRNGLADLTYEEIKVALVKYKHESKNLTNLPPHVMEFFRFAKVNNRAQNKEEKGDIEIAKNHLQNIRKYLRPII